MKKCTKCKKVKIKERGPNLCPACLKKIDEESQLPRPEGRGLNGDVRRKS